MDQPTTLPKSLGAIRQSAMFSSKMPVFLALATRACGRAAAGSSFFWMLTIACCRTRWKRELIACANILSAPLFRATAASSIQMVRFFLPRDSVVSSTNTICSYFAAGPIFGVLRAFSIYGGSLFLCLGFILSLVQAVIRVSTCASQEIFHSIAINTWLQKIGG